MRNREQIDMEKRLTHFDAEGKAIMVDVSAKQPSVRTALAAGKIRMGTAAFASVQNGTAQKGDVLGVARVAAIMGVKHTSSLIPLCHPIPVEKVEIEFELLEETSAVQVFCTVKTSGRTGVEMEALTGVNVALLTIYDMCKALDKGMEMYDIRLLKKTGGKSGEYLRRGEAVER